MRPVCKIFCLFSCAYELYYCKELLVTVELLLLLQHKHEVVAKTALHHHPIHSTWETGSEKYGLRGRSRRINHVDVVTRQIDVGCQEDNIFALQRCDGLVHLHQVRHHLIGQKYNKMIVMWKLTQLTNSHLLKAALPFAASAGARTRIRSELASLLVIHLKIILFTV